MNTRYEYIVVGSGAGGGTLVRELALRGKEGLCLEWGEPPPGVGEMMDCRHYCDFKRLPDFIPKPLRKIPLLPPRTEEGSIMWRAITAGGGSVISLGNGARCMEREPQEMGIDLGRKYAETEREIGLEPLGRRLLSKGSRRIREAAGALGYEFKPMPKYLNQSRCLKCHKCLYGCKFDAKWDTRIWLREAERHGATLSYNSEVKRLRIANGKVKGLAGRRYFRITPDERLPKKYYYDPDPNIPNKTYCDRMAVIDGWSFDPTRWKIPPITFAQSEIVHWLALHTAEQALQNAALDFQKTNKQRIGVVMGNSGSGEFHRSLLMPNRWPYVERAVLRAVDQALVSQDIDKLLAAIKHYYQGPFPEIREDYLAGIIGNVIAGRIANYYDFRGAAYIVDGACAWSLLAIIHACNHLAAGDMDVVLCGGVDVSLDPLQMVGFAKTQALAKDDIRPFDAQAGGIQLGEGCGLLVLASERYAREQGYRIRTLIKGWGISADGSGGITQPKAEGQRYAIEKAYEKAGYSISSLGYIEGHGTGTPVGDRVEITALKELPDAAGSTRSCHIGSVKANIGHTKAAAGAAGMIKAVYALERKILPPHINCHNPNPAFGRPLTNLRPCPGGPWESVGPRRVGVSGFGFGGTNTHITLEEVDPEARPREQELRLIGSHQQSELISLSATTPAELRQQAERLIPIARRICQAELTDLAAALAGRPQANGYRAALVSETPWQLASQLAALTEGLARGHSLAELDDPQAGLFLAEPRRNPRLALLFPGQGSQRLNMGRRFVERFPVIRELYRQLDQQMERHTGESLQARLFRDPWAVDEATWQSWEQALRDTRLQQPAIVACSLTGMRLLEQQGLRLVIANYNSPRQQVVSGPLQELERLETVCESRGIWSHRLPVSHAFHSPAVSHAALSLGQTLAQIPLGRLDRAAVYASSTGGRLPQDPDLIAMLTQQIVRPVRFVETIQQITLEQPDMWVEVGPGNVLAGLLKDILDSRNLESYPMELTLEDGLHLLNRIAARAFVLGFPVRLERLYEGRFNRSFDPENYRPQLLVNPCDRPVEPLANPLRLSDRDSDVQLMPAGIDESTLQHYLAERGDFLKQYVNLDFQNWPGRNNVRTTPAGIEEPTPPPAQQTDSTPKDASIQDMVIDWIVARTGYPREFVTPDKRLRDDLNLDSIKAGELALMLSKRLDRELPVDLGMLANASIVYLVNSVLEFQGQRVSMDQSLAGDWVKAFGVRPVPAPIAQEPEQALPSTGTFFVITQSLPDARSNALASAISRSGLCTCQLTLRQALEETPPGDLAGLVLILRQVQRPFYQLPAEDFKKRTEGLASALFQLLQRLLPSILQRVDFRLLVLRPRSTEDAGSEIDGDAALLKTISLENDKPGYNWKWLSFPAVWEAETLTTCAIQELQHLGARIEYHYADAGERLSPSAAQLSDSPLPAPRLGGTDTLLVSGGGKGITFELAYALAMKTGIKLGLLGSSPAPLAQHEESELAHNLRRLEGKGIRHLYVQADVSRGDEVVRAARQIDWNETGIGAKSGSLEVLKQIGVTTISTRQGVDAYLQLAMGRHPFAGFVYTGRLNETLETRLMPRGRIQRIHTLTPFEESLTEMLAPRGARYYADEFEQQTRTLSPAICDSMLQAAGLMAPAGYLPFAIEEICNIRPLQDGERLFCWARGLEKGANSLTTDILLYDQAGDPVHWIKRLVVKATSVPVDLQPRQRTKPLTPERLQHSLERFTGGMPISLAMAHDGELLQQTALSLLPLQERSRLQESVSKPRQTARLVSLLATRKSTLHFMREGNQAGIEPELIQIGHLDDGRPLLQLAKPLQGTVPLNLSLTDSRGIYSAAVSTTPIGIDLEVIETRDSETWLALLGEDGYALALRLQRETGESFDSSATRVWTLIKAGKKANHLQRSIPRFSSMLDDYWLDLEGSSEEDGRMLSTLIMDADNNYALSLAIRNGSIATEERHYG